MRLPHLGECAAIPGRVHGKGRRHFFNAPVGAIGLLASFIIPVAAQGQLAEPVSALTLDTPPATQPVEQQLVEPRSPEFKKMSLDELMNLEVTSVSKRPERLSESPSAITVITAEEIHRSGALSLPEALRLAPNLQVAQLNAHDWAITSRGFNGAPAANNAFSDKLLVMIDGRSVYTPLFGGVFWDVQNVLLEDVDRIEVVSGPGATLWGANAVNGVINVVTKSARDTQGLYLSGVGGTFWKDYGAARYGGQIGSNLFYRIYGMGFQHSHTQFANGLDANDDWEMKQTGFRMDYYSTHDDTLTFQGDVYGGTEGKSFGTGAPPPGSVHANVEGGNLIGRWTHTFSSESDLSVQLYLDDTWRHLPDSDFGYGLRTYDIDMQHRFPLGDRQSILWGAGYRLMDDTENNSAPLSFSPQQRNLQLFSTFVQDEIKLVPDRLKLTLGTKLEHNDYTGFELQPSARIAWTPTDRQTIWGAISLAVRTPSRFDQDEVLQVLNTPGNFKSEEVVAYELGYRVRPFEPLSLSVATFYNRYDDVRSINNQPSPPPIFEFANSQAAEAWGVELSGDYQLAEWWRLRGGYTYLNKRVWALNPSVVAGSDTFEGNDPHNQVVLQSMMDLPANFQFDLVGRYVDALEAPRVPSYFSMDARIAWHYRNLELSLVGQNLLDNQHPEFGAQEIPRSFYGQVTLRW